MTPAGDGRAAGARLALIGAIALMVTGCGPSAEDQERTKLLEAVDALRRTGRSDTAQRDELTQTLETLPVAQPDAVAARDACAAAYRAMNGAQKRIDDVAGKLQKDTATVAAAGQLLQAEQLLAEAEPLMEACDQAISRIRVQINP